MSCERVRIPRPGSQVKYCRTHPLIRGGSMSRLDMDDRAWSEAIEQYARRAGRKAPRRKGIRTAHVVAAAAVLAVLMSPWAAARTGDLLREGKRNPSSGASSRETEIISKSKTYGTRQSNTRDGN